jgi:hypothetical protein
MILENLQKTRKFLISVMIQIVHLKISQILMN